MGLEPKLLQSRSILERHFGLSHSHVWILNIAQFWRLYFIKQLQFIFTVANLDFATPSCDILDLPFLVLNMPIKQSPSWVLGRYFGFKVIILDNLVSICRLSTFFLCQIYPSNNGAAVVLRADIRCLQSNHYLEQLKLI